MRKIEIIVFEESFILYNKSLDNMNYCNRLVFIICLSFFGILGYL